MGSTLGGTFAGFPGPESPEPEPSEGFETIGLLEGDASEEGFPTNIEVKGLGSCRSSPRAF